MADAAAYHRRKKLYRALSVAAQTAFLTALTALRGGFLTKTFSASVDSGFLERAAYIAVFYALLQVVLWPLHYLSGWRLEKKFGLSKQSFIAWFGDFLKAQTLGVVFFTASALVFYAVAQRRPEDAWWILAALTFGFAAFFSALFPVWVLPLFYRTQPLADAALSARLGDTLRHCGFPGLPLFEIRMGEKTERANAMLTGFGATRRALISDTLIAKYDIAEIEMVLAHEAGHHARAHLVRSLFFEAATALVGFYALFRLFSTGDLVDLSFFPALALAAYLAGLAILPLSNSFSRMHEREADRFALEHYPDGNVFRSLMEKLALHNLSDPSPGKWEEFFLYTHPSKKKRIAAGEKFLRMFLANSRTAD